MWIQRQSPVRCRGAGSCYWADSILSVQNKILTWDEEMLVKILWTVTQTECCIHRQLDGIWESMWRFIMKSHHFNTSSIRDTWHRWKSRSRSKRRYICSILTLRTGRKVVVWQWNAIAICETFGRREDATWKTIWRTIQRTNHSLWSNGWVSSCLTEISGKNSSIWQKNISFLAWLWPDRVKNLERRYFW